MQAHPSINLPTNFDLWPENKKPGASPDDGPFPRFTYYLPSEEFRTGQTMLILPGGGYSLVSTAKEGHRPAQFLASHGVAAAVLEYRHSPSRYPIPLLDAQRAMRLIRQKAVEHGLDPAQIGVMGFSAGAHLAGLLATQPPHNDALVGDELDSMECTPNFAALIYPVVSFVSEFAHLVSRNNLLGENSLPDLAKALSLEHAVGPGTPPMFIVHEQNDPTCPSAGALALYQALTEASVPATLHLYEGDRHGFGLANNHPWGTALLQWLQSRER
jgi:acetyl esterase/lipase